MNGRQQAIERIEDIIPSVPGKEHDGEHVGTITSPPTLSLDPGSTDDELLRQVHSYYRDVLSSDAKAMAYLADHGISAEVASQYQLGYADRTLGLQLPNRQLRAGRAIRERLIGIGVLRASGHEHFTGSLVMPYLDEKGTITQLFGKKLLGRILRPGTPLEMTLPCPTPPMWNESALSSDHAVIVGTILDALVLIGAGIPAVAATGDPAAIASICQARGVREVRLAHPRTDAGEATARGLATALTAAGIACRRALLPLGADIAGLVRKNPTNAAVVTQAVATAVLMDPLPAPHGSTPSGEPAVAVASVTSVTEPCAPSPPQQHLDAPTYRVDGDDIYVQRGDRAYRVRGLAKNEGTAALRVTLRLMRNDALHVDAIDLYNAKNRVAFANAGSEAIGVVADSISRDLGRLILVCEQVQQEWAATASESQPAAAPMMTPLDESAALTLLRDPMLTQRIIDDFATCGLIGEDLNKLTCYLAAVSRKLDDPLAIVVQSSSAAGKTTLMDAALAFVPPEDLVSYSSLTAQALFYMAENGLSHRVLAIAEEAGSERVTYSLKLLQSEGELRIASTAKDAGTGKLVTTTYSVAGPVALFLTTTSITLDPELANRCLILAVDEGRAQTRAIHAAQRSRQTLEGRLKRQSFSGVLNLHRNAQRLLRPLLVVNPFAEHLTFPDTCTRTRRDHAKFLSLIEAVTFLHQHQRERKAVEHEGRTVEYIEATEQDLALATRLAHHALGRSLDQLPPQTRRLLDLITEMVRDACAAQAISPAEYRFTRRAVREHTHWGHSQLAIHLQRLEDMEHVVAHACEKGRGFIYELAHGSTPDAAVRLPGLTDLALPCPTMPDVSGGLPGEGRKLEKAIISQAIPQSEAGFRGSGESEERASRPTAHQRRRQRASHVATGTA